MGHANHKQVNPTTNLREEGGLHGINKVFEYATQMDRLGISAVDNFVVVVMSFVTLSFLVTTPECWVPALGSSEHGFPLLSGAGR